MGTPTQVCVWSCPNFSALAGRPFRKDYEKKGLVSKVMFRGGRGCDCHAVLVVVVCDALRVMSTPVFVDLEISTQADGDGTDTESEPIEDLVETETPESPFTIAPPTSLLESTPPDLVPILRRTARMAVRIPPTMSSGLSASMAEVADMSESAFRKRFRSSYESSPSLSPPDLPLRKRYRGMRVLLRGSRAPIWESRVESDRLGLGEEEEADWGGQQQVSFGCEEQIRQGSGSASEPKRLERVSASKQPTLTAWTDPEDGMVYIDVPAYPPPAPLIQTPPLLEWSSCSLPISPSPSIVPSPISSPMIPLNAPSPVATPAMAETEGFLTELGAQVQMQGGLIRDHAVRLEELSPALFERYQFRSLKYEQERVAVTFGAIWRPLLALESWAGHTDAQRVALWHVISDM
ncbi:hypothetical protein Tco_0671759 [Tanacetum coccineum]